MVWRMGAIAQGRPFKRAAIKGAAMLSAALSLGIGLPLQAQITEDAPSLIDEGTLLDEEISLPEGDDATNNPNITGGDTLYYDDDGRPIGAGQAPAGIGDNVIIINGRAYEYDPNDLEGNVLLENLTPLQNSATGAETEQTPIGVTGNDIAPDTPDVPGTGDRDYDDGIITYPPADRVQDLEPEDILE